MAAPSGTIPQPDLAPFSVKVGRTEVRIYPRAAERGRKAGFFVADYSTGKRRMRWFTDEKKARAEAALIAAKVNSGDAEGAAMTGDDRRTLLRATELVARFNLDVPTVCELFGAAADLVGAHAVVAACKAYAKRSPASRERLLLRDAADKYHAHKKDSGRSKRMLEDVSSRLGRFLEDHPSAALGDFTTGQIQSWLDGLKLQDGKPASQQTRKNFRTVISGMFEHFRRRGVIGDNPCEDLELGGTRGGADVQFWTVPQAEALLRAAGPEVRPALVVGLFSGVRTAELARLRWRDVDLAAGHVEIRAGAAKTASRRLAPIPKNAVAWLLGLRGKPEALIFIGHPTRLPKLVSEAAKAAGVPRIQNGARHSFITHRCAETGDVPRVAMEAGNSPGVVHAHYRGLVTQAEAARYFGILPGGSGNVVVPMERGADAA
jgi:integrase